MTDQVQRVFDGQGLELLLGGAEGKPVLWPLSSGPLLAVAHQTILRGAESGALHLGTVARGEVPVLLSALGSPVGDDGALAVDSFRVEVQGHQARTLQALGCFAPELRLALLARAAGRDSGASAPEEKVRAWVLHRPEGRTASATASRFAPDGDAVTRVWRELYAHTTRGEAPPRQPEEPFDVVLSREALGTLAVHLAAAPAGRETLWYGLGTVSAGPEPRWRFTVTVDRFVLADASDADGCSVRIDAGEVARVAVEAQKTGRRVLLKGHTHVVDLMGDDTADGAAPEDNRAQSLVDVEVFRRRFTHPLQLQCIVDGRRALDPAAPEPTLALYAYDARGLPRRRRYATEELRP